MARWVPGRTERANTLISRCPHLPSPRPPAEAPASSDSVANTATAAITVLAVVSTLAAGTATAKYFFGP